MLTTMLANFARVSPALALLSCAAPKANVVAEPPAPVEKKEDAALAAEPSTPGPPDDGIRLPDMLGLPGEGELRSSSPVAGGKPPEPGAVIARPPVEAKPEN